MNNILSQESVPGESTYSSLKNESEYLGKEQKIILPYMVLYLNIDLHFFILEKN